MFISCCGCCDRAQAKLIKLVDDGIVESYSKNMDLNNMKGLLPSHGGMFGDTATPLDGSISLEATQR